MVHICVNILVREIRFYRTRSGRSPVEDFLDSLPAGLARKVVWTLRLVEALEMVPAQYFRKLTGTEELWEVRAQHGGNIIRLLCFFDGPRVVVVTNGFAKKSQWTPLPEIARAEERRRDYLNRDGKDE